MDSSDVKLMQDVQTRPTYLAIASVAEGVKENRKYLIGAVLLMTVMSAATFGVVVAGNELAKESHVASDGVMTVKGGEHVVTTGQHLNTASLNDMLFMTTAEIGEVKTVALSPEEGVEDVYTVTGYTKHGEDKLVIYTARGETIEITQEKVSATGRALLGEERLHLGVYGPGRKLLQCGWDTVNQVVVCPPGWPPNPPYVAGPPAPPGGWPNNDAPSPPPNTYPGGGLCCKVGTGPGTGVPCNPSPPGPPGTNCPPPPPPLPLAPLPPNTPAGPPSTICCKDGTGPGSVPFVACVNLYPYCPSPPPPTGCVDELQQPIPCPPPFPSGWGTPPPRPGNNGGGGGGGGGGVPYKPYEEGKWTAVRDTKVTFGGRGRKAKAIRG